MNRHSSLSCLVLVLSILALISCSNTGSQKSAASENCVMMADSQSPSKKVCFENQGGLAVIEGDIVLGRVEDLKRAQNKLGRGAVSRAEGGIHRWANSQVPYLTATATQWNTTTGTIYSNLGSPLNINQINQAVTHHNNNTNIKFVAQTNESDLVKVIYLPDSLTDEKGTVLNKQGTCVSYGVGKKGGTQLVLLGSGCSVGNTIHELGHVLGLFHEQAREDRDLFVKVLSQNIYGEQIPQFERQLVFAEDIGAYDLGSIMHYNPFAFAIVKDQFATTYEAKYQGPSITLIDDSYKNTDSSFKFGQRIALSTGDISAINHIYGKNFIEAPDKLVSSNIGVSGGTLQFQDNSDSESHFYIEVAGPISNPPPANPIYNSLKSVPSSAGLNVVSANVSGLLSNSLYYFRVRSAAITNCGTSPCPSISSAPSAAIAVQTLVAPPSAPTSLVAKADSSSQITLTWTAPAGPVSSYVIDEAQEAGLYTVAKYATTSSPFVVSNLLSGVKYNFKIRAINIAGASADSNVASATTQVAQLASFSLSSSAVNVGKSVNGTLSLDIPAPQSGLVISLSANDPTKVSMPVSVTISGGAQTAQFSISSLHAGSVVLSAQLGSVSRSANLTINPLVVGNTVVQTSSSTSGAMRGILYTMPSAGSMSQINIYHAAATAGKNVVVGVYADNGSSTAPAPTTLLASSASTAVALTAGWQNINLSNPTVSLPAGKKVWLVFHYSSNPGTRYGFVTGVKEVTKTRTYTGTLPATFGTITSRTTAKWSLYGTYSP